jgi:LemA protein
MQNQKLISNFQQNSNNYFFMSKSTITLIVIGAVVLLLGFMGCGGYNGMVTKDQEAKSAWAKVQSQYQRRMDLIPNLVSTVKGYAEFEKSTLTAVIEARASATKMTVNADDLSPEKIKQFQASQGQLSAALGRLMVVSEQYPNLKANDQFISLQAELAGTENRIAVARNDFNDAVQSFNSSVKSFPTVLFSGLFGFKEKGYFEADAAADKAPSVKF